MNNPNKRADYPTPDQLAIIANRIRRGSLEATTQAGSGHPTSSFSCADLLAVLFFYGLRFDIDDPRNPANDRFVLSKGHAAPALWAALHEAGGISKQQLLSLRQVNSTIEGHPTTRNSLIDVPTGSLGQGLSMALGMALWSHKRGISNHTWALLGDGECAEGSVWEAAMLAAETKAEGLTAIIDVNRLGQTGETMYGDDCSVYERRFQAFGWSTKVIDGHDIKAIMAAIDWSIKQKGPNVIIAQTVKGQGVSFLADAENKHGKAVSDAQEYQQAQAELNGAQLAHPMQLHKPDPTPLRPLLEITGPLPEPLFTDPLATRHAYGAALSAAMEVDERLLVMDAEVSNSTGVADIAKGFPERYIECYIAEQNMVGMAVGCAALGALPCISSFAAFLTRAADQLRMAGLSGHHLLVAGSHAGVSIGEDGPSQMGLEDIALFRAINGASVLCPSDALSCYHLLPSAIAAKGLIYFRLARPPTPLLYAADDHDFKIGGSRILRSSDNDLATVVACGICVHEALKAADHLAGDGIGLRVIDAYSIQPLDINSITAATASTGHLITVEDHYCAGGLGEAVAAQVLPKLPGISFAQLAVRGLPRSGSKEALMNRHGIDAAAIIDTVPQLLASSETT